MHSTKTVLSVGSSNARQTDKHQPSVLLLSGEVVKDGEGGKGWGRSREKGGGKSKSFRHVLLKVVNVFWTSSESGFLRSLMGWRSMSGCIILKPILFC